MTRLAIVLALVAACTVDRDVLFTAVTTCTDALPDTTIGLPCSFAGTCEQSGAASPCDVVTVACSGGVVAHTTPADCTPCTDDRQCTYGSALCGSAQICEACPSLDVCNASACPADTAHLTRNGCEVCECAPPPTCSTNATAACTASISQCYAGAACATGCVATDPGCCSSQCAAPGCDAADPTTGVPSGKIPTGCAMPCTALPASCASNTCIATKCTCEGSAWSCTPACAAGATPSCTFTP